MDILKTLKGLFQKPAQDAAGFQFTAPASAPGIDDGVSYALPALLPRQLRDTLTQRGQLSRFLTESAAQTFRFQFDTPMRGTSDLPFMPPTEDPLREWQHSTREYVLSNTHAAYARNPLANRACKYTAAFVVGEGFNLTCKNKAVEEVLQAFIEDEDNQLRLYERQAPIDLLVDGEILLRLYRGEGETAGRLVAVPQRPWECQYIQTEKGFFRRRQSYHFVRTLTEGDSWAGGQTTETEDVAAADLLHVAINRHGYELRGRPELYAALPWLRAHKEFLENRARQNHWRTSFMWLVQVKSTAASTIAAVAARWRRPPTPGSVAVESEAVNVQALSNPIGANDASEDGRQLKLMNAVAFGLPEYFLADGSNANLASSTSQQLPALMTFGDMKRTLVEELWTPLFRLVIQEAVAAGTLPDQVVVCDADGDPLESGEMCDTVDAFDVSYAPLQDNNIQSLATALEIAARNGWVDDETAATEMGFDWGIVAKRLKQQKENTAADMRSGLTPEPPEYAPPGMEDDEDEDGEEPNGLQRSANGATAQTVAR